MNNANLRPNARLISDRNIHLAAQAAAELRLNTIKTEERRLFSCSTSGGGAVETVTGFPQAFLWAIRQTVWQEIDFLWRQHVPRSSHSSRQEAPCVPQAQPTHRSPEYSRVSNVAIPPGLTPSHPRRGAGPHRWS